ncbi:hypothetical protein [Pseudomonas peli]|uniref:hypothetical protein n=1 Tax=Pseudomonas peli TaxID=592361 RepID=UPI003D15BFB9
MASRWPAAALKAGDEQRHPLAQQVVMLRHSRRFGEGSGIGQLARLVNRQSPQARACWPRRRPTCTALPSRRAGPGFRPPAARRPEPRCRRPARLSQLPAHLGRYRPALETGIDDPRWEQWAGKVLHSFEDFQLLCAVRRGAWGVEGLNERVARVLHDAGLIDSQQPWYEGRPVLVTRNDYGLGLMNGDIGIALRLPDRAW